MTDPQRLWRQRQFLSYETYIPVPANIYLKFAICLYNMSNYILQTILLTITLTLLNVSVTFKC